MRLWGHSVKGKLYILYKKTLIKSEHERIQRAGLDVVQHLHVND